MLSIKMIMALLAIGAITHAAPVANNQLGPNIVGRDADPLPQGGLADARQRLDLDRQQADQRFNQRLQQDRSRFDELNRRPEKRDADGPPPSVEDARARSDRERIEADQRFNERLQEDRRRIDELHHRPEKRDPPPPIEDARARHDLEREQARQQFELRLQQDRERADRLNEERRRPEKRDAEAQTPPGIEDSRQRLDLDREQARQRFEQRLQQDRERADRLDEERRRPEKRDAEAQPPPGIEDSRQRLDLDREQARQRFEQRLQQDREGADRLNGERRRPEKRDAEAEAEAQSPPPGIEDARSRLDLDREQARQRFEQRLHKTDRVRTDSMTSVAGPRSVIRLHRRMRRKRVVRMRRNLPWVTTFVRASTLIVSKPVSVSHCFASKERARIRLDAVQSLRSVTTLQVFLLRTATTFATGCLLIVSRLASASTWPSLRSEITKTGAH
ncbi:uncharacterized protein J3D65DRAFT_72034 [Phyllosticta citribraziliensis]|uniref:Uncharacterized protein n=1 Tax=Phyllosticta citribraziliensis TaxID=989973 RepID=A0ABR1LD47_9PEZI